MAGKGEWERVVGWEMSEGGVMKNGGRGGMTNNEDRVKRNDTSIIVL